MPYQQDLEPIMNPPDKLLSRKRKDWLDTEKSGSTHFCMVVSLLCAALIGIAVCSGFLIYVLVVLSSVTTRLDAAEAQLSLLREQCQREELETYQVVPEDDGYENDEPELYERDKRNAKQQNVIPYIHLHGDKKFVIEANTEYFSWVTGEDTSGIHGFTPIGDSKNHLQRIKIKQQGVYIIYAQVAINGRKSPDQHNECSHETVLRRGHEVRVLLKSLVTQHNLSGASYKMNSQMQEVRALDTSVHMGVFMLYPDDEVFVQIPQYCGNQIYTIQTNNTYFGLAQLWLHKPKLKRPKPNRNNNKKNKQ